MGQQFYTVQKYAMATDHGMAGAVLEMNQAKWGSLTPEQRKRLDDLPKEVYAAQIPQFLEELENKNVVKCAP